jgi:hypothetical protein
MHTPRAARRSVSSSWTVTRGLRLPASLHARQHTRSLSRGRMPAHTRYQCARCPRTQCQHTRDDCTCSKSTRGVSVTGPQFWTYEEAPGHRPGSCTAATQRPRLALQRTWSTTPHSAHTTMQREEEKARAHTLMQLVLHSWQSLADGGMLSPECAASTAWEATCTRLCAVSESTTGRRSAQRERMAPVPRRSASWRAVPDGCRSAVCGPE